RPALELQRSGEGAWPGALEVRRRVVERGFGDDAPAIGVREVGVGGVERDLRLPPDEHLQPTPIVVLVVRVLRLAGVDDASEGGDRNPHRQRSAVSDTSEVLGGDADDGEGGAIDLDRLAEDRRASCITTLPEAVREDDDRGAGGDRVLARREEASECWRRVEEAEV